MLRFQLPSEINVNIIHFLADGILLFTVILLSKNCSILRYNLKLILSVSASQVSDDAIS